MTTIAMNPAPLSPPESPARNQPRQQWVGGNMPVARLGVYLNLLVPLAILLWDAFRHQLGADPVKNAIHTTGFVSVTFLVLSLCVTPVRMLTGLPWLTQFRRALGVYAFYYAAVHLAIYFWWDRSGSVSATAYEITHRYYLAIGFGSLALMAPLWATSLNIAIQTLGGVVWRRLHRLAYPAAALACYHFYLQSKADKREPDLYFAILGIVLAWRLVSTLLKSGRAAALRGGAFPVIPMAAAGKAKFWKGQMKLVGIFKETADVRTFRLASVDGGPVPFTYRAGQYLSLALDIDGKRVTRSYTIASPPTRDAYIELSIKREANGLVSRHLHDMMMHGQSVSVTAPAGHFTFDPKSERAVLLIAGGVGITPVMSILRDLTDQCWPGKIDLIFSIRTPADVIFADELRYLSARHPNLSVHYTITRDAPADWTGLRGRINADMVRMCVPDAVTRPAFICGPDAMANAARDELIAVGLPANRITLESFTSSAVAPKDSGVMTGEALGTVQFTRSGKSASLRPRMTVLDAAESVGVSIDYQCRSGICGTCRCKLLAGSVEMAVKDALTDSDQAAGYILACQATASGDVSIDA